MRARLRKNGPAMRSRRLVLFSACALAACFAGVTPARADRIDGHWCADDGRRTLSIDGPRIVTSGGNTLEGDYGRHHFAFVVPAGEPDAGTTVEMFLLNEETVRVETGEVKEIWHRCDLTA